MLSDFDFRFLIFWFLSSTVCRSDSDIPVVFPGHDSLSPDRSLSSANIRSKTFETFFLSKKKNISSFFFLLLFEITFFFQKTKIHVLHQHRFSNSNFDHNCNKSDRLRGCKSTTIRFESFYNTIRSHIFFHKIYLQKKLILK